MVEDDDALGQIRDLVVHEDPSADITGRIAEGIRSGRGYRWVGIYEVTEAEIVALAWTGTEAPTYPRFPITQGLCGAAVESHAPVVVGDVKSDPRYLTTFGNTRSEIVVPAMDEMYRIVGLIDVESEHLNAFQDEDARFLQNCASAILPMFRTR